MSAQRTLLVMAGGTGGHIFPALAVAQAMRERGWQVIWLGARNAMETRIVPQYDIPLETLAITGVRGKGLLKKLVQPWVQACAVLGACRVIMRYRPQAAIGFGGFTGFPGGVAMRLLRLPLLVHEQNSVAGLTNKTLSRLADRVLYAFPSAFAKRAAKQQEKYQCIGNPVRSVITAVVPPEARFAGRQGPLRLLVVGGSLGAQVLNEVVPMALGQIPDTMRPLVRHQAGEKHLDTLQANYAAAGVQAECSAFIADMAAAYAEADLVLCRSGALTIAELAAAGVASILVPFPHAVDDHQTGNARYLSEAGAGILIRQPELDAARLTELLLSMTRERCLEMAQKARALGKPDATQSVVQAIEELAD